jgi:hypothetical protein
LTAKTPRWRHARTEGIEMDVIAESFAMSIVQRRGTIRAGIGRAVGGLAGAAIATQRGKGNSPLQAQFGFVAVLTDRIVVLEAKGAFKSKPTNVILGEGARTGAWARFHSSKLSGVLEIRFADGSMWAFDIPRAGLGDAQHVAATVGEAPAVNGMFGDDSRGVAGT